MSTTVPACPACHSAENVRPILYGLPTHDAFESAERGEVILGGCCISFDSPKWYCTACGENFGLVALLPAKRPQRSAEHD